MTKQDKIKYKMTTNYSDIRRGRLCSLVMFIVWSVGLAILNGTKFDDEQNKESDTNEPVKQGVYTTGLVNYTNNYDINVYNQNLKGLFKNSNNDYNRISNLFVIKPESANMTVPGIELMKNKQNNVQSSQEKDMRQALQYLMKKENVATDLVGIQNIDLRNMLLNMLKINKTKMYGN